ncbi:ribonuclease H-like domain-containing protein, partial [Trametes polyzona]
MQKYLPREEARIVAEDMKRLESKTMLTMMTDGWEDELHRALYGTLLAELGSRLVVLSLEDISGERATAVKLLEVVELALKKKGTTIKQLICLVTDNPTTMRAFRHLFEAKYLWVLTTYCSLHVLNTNVGKATDYPAAKQAISANTRIVSFFTSSHYWGGQLEAVKGRLGLKRRLKTHTAMRWYSLILQAVSVQKHCQALIEVCLRDDTQQSWNGYSVINTDIVKAVLDVTHWQRNAQLIRICKPLIDAIGNLESRDATLADCMLELIWAECQMATLVIEDTDDLAFTWHAQQMIHKGFHEMNTDLHWFTLFLHPLGQQLVVTSATHSRQVKDAYRIALGLAKRWNWTKESAKQLIIDIEQYSQGNTPFTGGTIDTVSWWKSPLIASEKHPLKAMAIRVLSIVPHSAKIERLFSNLRGVQNPKRCRLSVSQMETHGVLRNHYNHDLLGGATIRWHHAHMHTHNRGLDVRKLTDLTANW